MTERSLSTLWQRGTAFLGVDYAILGGAMTWVSERTLVAAISNAGGFGVLASGSMPPDIWDAEITATRTLTDRPFGVNLILLHPELDAMLDVCAAYSCPFVVLAGGIPKPEHIQRVKGYGGKVIAFAPALVVAKRLMRMGVDALIIEGAEAGGHIGPVSTSVLAQEILPNVQEVPVFIAGGIGRGEMIASYLEMGAAGCQLGTRFVCAEESIAHPRFKECFIRSAARHATTSMQIDPEFPVIPVRAIANQATADFIRCQHDTIAAYRTGALSREDATLKIEHFWAGALRRAVMDGDIEHGSVMAGQSVGMVSKVQPCTEIIAELIAQAEEYLAHHCPSSVAS